jgi:hypothetical protein
LFNAADAARKEETPKKKSIQSTDAGLYGPSLYVCLCVCVRSENEFLASHIDDRVITNVDLIHSYTELYSAEKKKEQKRREEEKKSYNTFCRHRLKIFQLAEPTPKAAVSLTT